jgi:hypothetical protein
MNLFTVSCFFLSVGCELQVTSPFMAIDLLRLARIRMRFVAAAATLVVPACGGNGQPNINEPAQDPPHKQFDGPINDRDKEPPMVSPRPDPQPDPPPTAQDVHINTPPPQSPTPPAPKQAPQPDHINTPRPN